ncbi:MFS general substrate transporter [Mycena floridula]|nr:MFS general substrate transporter [Mycena floridula]
MSQRTMVPSFLRTLVPRPEVRTSSQSLFKVIQQVTWLQWAQCFSGYAELLMMPIIEFITRLAESAHGLAIRCSDFFSVALSVTNLSKEFNRPTHDITKAITLSLLLRPVGAMIFGMLSDRFGRKWPLVLNLVILGLLELGAGFSKTFSTFLALRALFEARGLASGIVQQGYPLGSLLATVINLALVPQTKVGWRALFWCASGCSFFVAGLRAVIPESQFFLIAKERDGQIRKSEWKRTCTFVKETRGMLRRHWILAIYAVIFSTGINFIAHGSQDLYPTYLQTTKRLSPRLANLATIISNCGNIAGTIAGGIASQYFGRRLTMILSALFAALFIPLWIVPVSFKALVAGAFFLQVGVGVGGITGAFPIYMAEISLPAVRALFTGVVHQIGTMISSASAQIEATAGDNLKTTVRQHDGSIKVVADFAKVQGIFIGVVLGYFIIVTLVGPENHGSHFERHKAAFEEGAALDEETSSSPDLEEKRVEVEEVEKDVE